MSKQLYEKLSALSKEERQRHGKASPYVGYVRLEQSTSKHNGSPIVAVDTIKGCSNNCFRCYANRISRFKAKVHNKPVRCVVVGKPIQDICYRFGTFGDPASDWQWTTEQLDNLEARGMKTHYLVTKLQDIKDFPNGRDLNVHVSFDLFDPDQLRTTMINFDRIDAKRVIRIKTILSKHTCLMRSQKKVVAFAVRRGVPIIETRFYTQVKHDLKFLKLVAYKRVGKIFKYGGSVLRDVYGLDSHLMCSDGEGGLCRNCLNCLKLIEQMKGE